MKRILTKRNILFTAMAVSVALLAALVQSVVNLPLDVAGMPHSGGAGLAMAGMLVNKENLHSIFVTFKTTFMNALTNAPSTWQQIAMEVPSTGAKNDYGWLSSFPKMREWIGDKVVKALEAFDYSIKNRPFETTIKVKRDDIEDDNLGIYKPQAEMAGESAAQLPDEIVYELVNKGFTNKGYDGQYFFDTDHPGKDADGNVISVSNKGTKKLSCANQAAALASLGAAEVALMEMTDDEGRPLNIKPTVLLVPPALKAIANTLYTAERLEDGAPNPYKGSYKPVVETRLTSKTAWYLLDTSKPIKPFIYQSRKKPVFVQMTDAQSENVFMRGEFFFGAEARAAGGYGPHQLAYGSDGTVA